MLESWPRLQSVSIHIKLAATGFDGSYPTVVRAVRDIRGPRFRAADAVSVPINTDPGEEAQFDFCDLGDWAARFGWKIDLVCFGMIWVVVALSDVVVHHVGGSPSHLRRHRPLLRPDRRCSDGVSHRSDGSTRPIPGQALRAARADGRFRGASLDEDHLVSGS